MTEQPPSFAVGDILNHAETGPKHDPDRPHHMIVAIVVDDVFLVPICTWRKRHGEVPIVEACEARDILDRKSCLLMGDVMVTTVAIVEQRMRDKKVRKSTKARDELLAKAVDALYDHPSVEEHVRRRLPSRVKRSRRPPRRATC